MGWIKLTEIPNQRVDDKEYDINYWRIEDGYIWHQDRKLRKADVETFEVRDNEDQEFIARDKNSVYHGWSTVTSIDRKTFEEVANGYWKDKNNVYCEHETSIKPIKGMDPKNFKFIGGPYARDSKFAYYAGRVIKSCENPMGLQLMREDDCWTAGDKEKVYYDGAEIKGADFDSWEKVQGAFSKDNKSIFYGSKKLPQANLENWDIIEGSYSSDEKNVYDMHLKLKKADPKSWELIDHYYSKDKNYVFYGNKIIENADPKTFKVLGPNKAKDKNNKYDGSCIK